MVFRKKADIFAVAAVAVLVAVLSIGTSKGHGKSVPLDDRHKHLYEALKGGRPQGETELVCATCHGSSSLPLPKNHPPKEQCLLCHHLA